MHTKGKKPLIVTAIDYKKAFDSIDRAKMIVAMKKYKIEPKIIDNIAEIYNGNKTEVVLREDMKETMEVTSGIRQGCTGSTLLFKLITYIIMEKLEKEGKGYKNELFILSSLFFADDGLILTENLQAAVDTIGMLIQISKECGLDLNKEKSNIIMYNLKEQPMEIEGIQVVSQIKYLGVMLSNKRKLFQAHKLLIQEKAIRYANMTYSIIEKSVNKLLIGKTYWKNLVLPSLLHSIDVLTLTKTDIAKLQVIENGVYRKILGAPSYAPSCTLRGEIGASLMKTRIMKGRMQYLRSIKERNNDLLKKILLDMEDRKFAWFLETEKYAEELKIDLRRINDVTKKQINDRAQHYDEQVWNEERQEKSSLTHYNRMKPKLKEEKFYDNSFASVLLYKARTNTLPLNDRGRHVNGDTSCGLCGEGIEDLQHFLLRCPMLMDVRASDLRLQRPFGAEEEDVITTYLSEEAEIEKSKEILYLMYMKREKLKEETR